MRYINLILLIAASQLLNPSLAQAYIGPGIGTGVVAVVLGIIGSVCIAIGAIVYYPIKRMIKRRRKAKSADNEDGNSSGEG